MWAFSGPYCGAVSKHRFCSLSDRLFGILASIGVNMELFFVPAGVWKSLCFQPVATSEAFVLPAGPNLEPRSQFGASRLPKLVPKR